MGLRNKIARPTALEIAEEGTSNVEATVRETTQQWLDNYITMLPHEALQGLPLRQSAIQHA